MGFSTLERRLSYKLSEGRKRRGRYYLLFLLVLILAFTAFTLERLEPAAVNIAMANITDMITVEISDIITDMILSKDIDYDDLVSFEKDSSGNITALITNMPEINSLSAELSKTVTENLVEVAEVSVSVPLGNVIGGALLSGRGPEIPVSIISISNVTTRFRNEFSSAGINQTRHRIMLDIEVSVGILLAGRSDYWDSIHTEMVVAETVIVGKVPESYAYFNQ